MMAGFDTSNTMPKIGHVTGLREQWLVRTDGALAHHLQDREISSHLYENRSRNQQIREDFPVALSEQRDLEYEARKKEMLRRRQAEIDAEIAREMAEINLRRQRRQYSADLLQQPSSSRAQPPALEPKPLAPEPARVASATVALDVDPEELGLSSYELEEIRKRLEQEERDARLARELSHEAEGEDALFADMKYAVEAQDSELARLLQEREYKKLQRAKERARQKALLKKQQRLAAQKQNEPLPPEPIEEHHNSATLLDAYSNPRDMIHQSMKEQNGLRLCKSVDSDLHYVEPFEKEQIQSKSSALQAKEISKQYYNMPNGSTSRSDSCQSTDLLDHRNMPSTHSLAAMQHRQPPPPPATSKKPRFPDPVSIRPASHYPMDHPSHQENSNTQHISHSYSENNNIFSSTFPPDYGTQSTQSHSTLEGRDPTKRLSVISDITAEGLAKKKSKAEKKKKGCKIQ